MKTLNLNQMESVRGGISCQTQIGLGVGLLFAGLLLGAVTFGVGAAVAVAGFGIGNGGMYGKGCER